MLKSLVGQFRTFQPNLTEGLDLCYVGIPVAAASPSAEDASPVADGASPPSAAPAVADDEAFRVSRVVACCAPSTGGIKDSLLRNDVKKLVKFLDQRHGPGHYRVYNLTEKPHKPDIKKAFRDEVRHIPIPDHNIPRWESVEEFCRDAQEFLGADERNAVVVHCKAGKGRTGTLICCYLLFSGACRTSDEALDLFAQSRSRGRKSIQIAADGSKEEVVVHRGVDQASQVRWVHYFGDMMKMFPGSFEWIPMMQQVRRKLSFIVLKNLPSKYKQPTVAVRKWGLDKAGGELIKEVSAFKHERHLGEDTGIFFFDMADVEVQCETKIMVSNSENGKHLCRLWFHPGMFFDQDLVTVPKARIDDVWNKKWPEEFCVEIHLFPLTEEERVEVRKRLKRQPPKLPPRAPPVLPENSAQDIQDWLHILRFSEEAQQVLAGMDGQQLLDLDRPRCLELLGSKEGGRLFNSLSVSRSKVESGSAASPESSAAEEKDETVEPKGNSEGGTVGVAVEIPSAVQTGSDTPVLRQQQPVLDLEFFEEKLELEQP